MKMDFVLKKTKDFFIDSEFAEQRQCLQESYLNCEMKFENLITHPSCDLSIKSILGKDVLDDVEMFRPYKENNETIYSIFSPMHFKGTSFYLKHLLENPLYQKDVLETRKSYLQLIEKKKSYLETEFSKLKDIEKDIWWLYQDRDANITALYDMVYFKFWFLKELNQYPAALTSMNVYRIFVSPLIGILSPITYFIIPYMILNYKYKIKISFTTYIKLLFQSSKLMMQMNGLSSGLQYTSLIFSLIFYFQSMFNSIELSKTIYNISDFITKRMKHIMTFMNITTDIFKSHPDYERYIEEIFNLKTEPIYNIQYDIPKGFINNIWILSNFGTLLHYFKKLDKNYLKLLLSKTYMLDALLTVIKTKTDMGLNYVHHYLSHDETNDEKSLLIKLHDFWHPCINPDKAVKNTIELYRNKRNMIITGPNAGGKSTLVKSILSNILLAQTCCITFGKECILYPFTFINSQINIPDCKGKESLFQAEMHRCKFNLDKLNSGDIPEKSMSILFMDEILNSTNPVEGISGSYAILKKLGQYNNCIVIFTTHYAYLTKLEKITEMLYLNYRMNVLTNGNVIEFPYKLQRGISTQYIALQLLTNEGFNDDIIKDALELKDKLTKKK
jgi:hypothetical protein